MFTLPRLSVVSVSVMLPMMVAQPSSLLDKLRASETVVVNSMELRGTLHWDIAPTAVGATVIRLSPPDRFFIVERNPGSSTVYVAGLNGAQFWTRLDGQDGPAAPEAMRRIRTRMNHHVSVFLLRTPAGCVTQPKGTDPTVLEVLEIPHGITK